MYLYTIKRLTCRLKKIQSKLEPQRRILLDLARSHAKLQGRIALEENFVRPSMNSCKTTTKDFLRPNKKFTQN